MKVFVVLSLVVCSAVIAVADKTCKENIDEVCKKTDYQGLPTCSAKYAGAMLEGKTSVLGKLQAFAIDQLQQSFEFMLRASYFGNYKASRPGFAKVFRGLSDAAWNDAIGITKLVAERGGDSVFKDKPIIAWDEHIKSSAVIGIEELPSLGRALDSVKHLAKEANSIHHRATHHETVKGVTEDANNHQHDAHIAHYIQEEFSERYAKEVRNLAGHATDLKSLLLGKDGTDKPTGREKSLSLFLFDEYLLKL